MTRSVQIRNLALALALALAAGVQADVTEQQAIDIAVPFIARAARGLEAQPSLTTADTQLWVEPADPPLSEKAYWHIWFRHGICSVRKSDGKIGRFVMNPDRHPELEETYPLRSTISLQEATTLAFEYLALAGYADTYVVSESELLFPEDLQGAMFQFWLRPLRGSVVVLRDAIVEVEPTTGFLERLIVDDPPAIPPSLVPAVPIEAAHAIMAAYAGNVKGFDGIYEDEPAILGIWAPIPMGEGQDSRLTPDQITIGQNNQGMLVYFASIGETASYSPRLGGSARRFSIWIDAMTGEILGTLYSAGWGFLGAPVSRPNPAGKRGLPEWNWCPGPTSVYAGRKFQTAAKGDVLSAPAPAKPPVGKAIILRRARMLVPCRFDPASGLVWRVERKRRIYGKPNPELLKAIRRLVAT